MASAKAPSQRREEHCKRQEQFMPDSTTLGVSVDTAMDGFPDLAACLPDALADEDDVIACLNGNCTRVKNAKSEAEEEDLLACAITSAELVPDEPVVNVDAVSSTISGFPGDAVKMKHHDIAAVVKVEPPEKLSPPATPQQLALAQAIAAAAAMPAQAVGTQSPDLYTLTLTDGSVVQLRVQSVAPQAVVAQPTPPQPARSVQPQQPGPRYALSPPPVAEEVTLGVVSDASSPASPLSPAWEPPSRRRSLSGRAPSTSCSSETR